MNELAWTALTEIAGLRALLGGARVPGMETDPSGLVEQAVDIAEDALKERAVPGAKGGAEATKLTKAELVEEYLSMARGYSAHKARIAELEADLAVELKCRKSSAELCHVQQEAMHKYRMRTEALEKNQDRHVESMTKMIGQRDIYTPKGLDMMLKIRVELKALLEE